MELAIRNNAAVQKSADWPLRAVGALVLAWSLYGAARLLYVQFGLFDTGMPASAELARFAALPQWASAFWTVSVWGLVAGSALLMLRSKWAVQAFVFALIGIIGTSTQLFIIAEQPANIYAMPIALSMWVITMAALLHASRVEASGMLR